MKDAEDEAFDDIARRQAAWGGGFKAKQAMAADKLQELVNLLEARRIAAEYGTPGSQVDDGNLYFALSKCLEHIDAQPAQEPVTEREALKLAKIIEHFDSNDESLPLELLKEIAATLRALAQPAQEPVAWVWKDMRGQDIVSLFEPRFNSVPLYTTPPQPAQEPDWKTMEAKYPSLEKLDIRMGDGSILCDVWPQSDGDFWWAGSGTGEKFIDPKYADVTHWRVHSDTTPPQREWVGLTDEEIKTIVANYCLTVGNWSLNGLSVAQAVAAKLKEKNNGT